jgi:hypothetical protein
MTKEPVFAGPPSGINVNTGRISSRGAAVVQPGGAAIGSGCPANEAAGLNIMASARKEAERSEGVFIGGVRGSACSNRQARALGKVVFSRRE